MKHSDLKDNLGKRVKINGNGDLAMIREFRKFIYDDTNRYELILKGITKEGKAFIGWGDNNIIVGCKNVDLYEENIKL